MPLQRKRLIVAEVTGQKAEDHLGYEIAIGDDTYSYAANQWLWPGLRCGRFPNDADGVPFPRVPLFATRLESGGAHE